MSKKKGFDTAIEGDLLGKISPERRAEAKKKLEEIRERRKEADKSLEALKQGSIIKQLETANKMMEMEIAAMNAESNGKVGRPAKNHGRKRTSVIVAPELWNEFKILSMKHGSSVSDFLEIAINDALEKYEK